MSADARTESGPWDGTERRVEHRTRVQSEGSPDQGLMYLADCIERIDGRLDRGADRMDTMQQTMETMQVELSANTAVTNDVAELLAAARSGLKVLGWLGTGSLWVIRAAGYIAGACTAIYVAWYGITHGGALPPGKP